MDPDLLRDLEAIAETLIALTLLAFVLAQLIHR